MSELLEMTATEQARLLADGSISALELADYYLRRIERDNPELNAFIYLARRRGRLAAQRWDRARARGSQPSSPLSGVPTGIKDLALVRGMPNRFGSRALPRIYAIRDGLITQRIRRAGMIVLGKLSTAEFGAMPVTEPDTHGPTRNPFHLDYTAGGSSGGSGAAVAGGLLPIAQGSDGAGSIRIPSALGHLVGLKPSRGLISHVTPVDRELRLSVVGPLARSVEDVAAFMDCTSDSPKHFLEAYKRPLPAGLRVALSTDNPICSTPAIYQDAARRVAELLAGDAGPVERPWLDVEVEEFLVLWKRLMANAPWLMEARLQPVTAWLRTLGRKIPRAAALAQREQLERRVLSWFGDFDLWVSPTLGILPPQIGSWRAAEPESSFNSVLGLGVYTAVYNVSGQPAISIPMGLDDKGLPIGVQIAAPVGGDAMLLRAARVVEESVGGFLRLPAP